MTTRAFQWNEAFLIGIEELDHEHKALIDDINRLHENLKQQVERSEIEQCLGEIFARMQAHFALEEHVMCEHQYPYYQEHKREHDALLESYTENMLRFLNDSSGLSSKPIEDSLTQWVIHHILSSDKKMSLMVQKAPTYRSGPR